MKYCTKCGNELMDDAVICPKCGCPTELYNKNLNNPTNIPVETNVMAVIALISSFFIPLLGWIFGALGYKKSKEMNGNGKDMSLAAIIISTVEFLLTLLVIIEFLPYLE